MEMSKLEEKAKILRDDFKTLVLIDYCYECDDTPYFYKIYKFINEHGEPMPWPVIGARYNEFTGEEIQTVIGHRQYKRSYKDYKTYEDALEAGIMEATIMATLLTTILPDKPDIYGRVYSEEVKKQIIEYLKEETLRIFLMVNLNITLEKNWVKKSSMKKWKGLTDSLLAK